LAEQLAVFRQGRQDQRQVRWLRMVFRDLAVHGAKESFRINIHFRRFISMAMVHGRLSRPGSAIGGHSVAWLGHFFSQSLGHGARHSLGRRNLP
jgi:hypothetical protein